MIHSNHILLNNARIADGFLVPMMLHRFEEVVEQHCAKTSVSVLGQNPGNTYDTISKKLHRANYFSVKLCYHYGFTIWV